MIHRNVHREHDSQPAEIVEFRMDSAPDSDLKQLDILQLASCQDNAFDRTNKFDPDEKETVYVYRTGNKIFGYVMFYIQDNLLWLGEMSATEHDIGVSLLKFVIGYAKNKNTYTIASNVNHDNHNAIDMYESAGFKTKYSGISSCMEINFL